MILEALLQLTRTASFFIPGSLGAQEGVLALVVLGFGYVPALGVAVSLLKRLRQVIWTILGFIVWGLIERLPRPPALSKPQAVSRSYV